MAFDPQVTPVDFVVLGGQRTPGVARVRNAHDSRKWDVQQGPFLAGGITIFRGRELAKPSIDIRLLTAQDWIDWANFQPIVARPPFGKRPKALTIKHPWTDMMQISEVQVEKVYQPEEDGDTGAYIVTIDLLEFRQPKIALAKPDAATDKPDNDPYNALIRDLTKQLGDLAAHKPPP